MTSLEKKITFSFGAISLAFLAMTLVVFVQVNQVTTLSARIQNVLEPSIEANLDMTSALHSSLASVQSWVLMKEDPFIRQRKAAWSLIDKKYKQLQNHSQNWQDSSQIISLNRLHEDLSRLRQLQEKVEAVVYDESHLQAVRILEEEVNPLTKRLRSQLRRIVDPQRWEMARVFVEKKRQEDRLKRIAVVFLVASVIGSVALGLLLVRAVIAPLNRTIGLANAIAQGDYSLHKELLGSDEALDVALRVMTVQLSEKDEENRSQRDELKRYNQQLEMSNEELSQFAYRTSHDLRAPLITVRGLAEIVNEDIVDGEYDEAIESSKTIIVHVQKLENLVGDILDLAKADLEITAVETVNMKALVLDIKERLQSVYLQNDVGIEMDVDASIDFHVSKARITQVLENLISNAIKYCDADKAFRFVRVSIRQSEESYLCIVEDNGVGIPEEFFEKVFTMFQRFHPKIAYGSGLGMYIIKKHVDKMNGKISFESSNDGSKFVLEVPRLQQN